MMNFYLTVVCVAFTFRAERPPLSFELVFLFAVLDFCFSITSSLRLSALHGVNDPLLDEKKGTYPATLVYIAHSLKTSAYVLTRNSENLPHSSSVAHSEKLMQSGIFVRCSQRSSRRSGGSATRSCLATLQRKEYQQYSAQPDRD